MASKGQPDYQFVLTPQLSASLERMRQTMEPKVGFTLTPEPSASLERMSQMIAPKIDVAFAPELAETSRTLSKAFEPMLSNYRATFEAIQPSLDLLVTRMNEISVAVAPAAESFARIQRQIAEAMAPSLPAIRSFNAQFQEAMAGVDWSALAEGIRAISDLDEEELERLIADLDDDEVEPAFLPDDELLDDWVVLRKAVTALFALAVGARLFELHVEDLELAAMVDAVLTSAGVSWSVYRFLNKPRDKD